MYRRTDVQKNYNWVTYVTLSIFSAIILRGVWIFTTLSVFGRHHLLDAMAITSGILISIFLLRWQTFNFRPPSSADRLNRKLNDIKGVLRTQQVTIARAIEIITNYSDLPNDQLWQDAQEAIGAVLIPESNVSALFKEDGSDQQQLQDTLNVGNNLLASASESDRQAAATSVKNTLNVLSRLRDAARLLPATEQEYLLASANVFVEEAQEMLTKRAGWFIVSGLVCFIALSVLLLWATEGAHESLSQIAPFPGHSLNTNAALAIRLPKTPLVKPSAGANSLVASPSNANNMPTTQELVIYLSSVSRL